MGSQGDMKPVNERFDAFVKALHAELHQYEIAGEELKEHYVENKPSQRFGDWRKDIDVAHRMSMECTVAHNALLGLKARLPELIGKVREIEQLIEKRVKPHW